MKLRTKANSTKWIRRAKQQGAKAITILFAMTIGIAIMLSVYLGNHATTVAFASGPTHKGPPIPNGRVFAPPPAPQAAPKLGPNACNSWIGLEGASGKPITAHFGEIRNCDLVGGDWVVTTLGLPQQAGAVGVDACNGTANCLDGRNSRDIHAWVFYQAPFIGGVTILQVVAPGVLIVDDGGHELQFTLATGQYHS